MGVLKLGQVGINSGINQYEQFANQERNFGYNKFGFTRDQLKATKFMDVAKYLLQQRKFPLRLNLKDLDSELV